MRRAAVLLLLVACAAGEPVDVGWGYSITVITLSDGTRCAVSNAGAISCDWRER